MVELQLSFKLLVDGGRDLLLRKYLVLFLLITELEQLVVTERIIVKNMIIEIPFLNTINFKIHLCKLKKLSVKISCKDMAFKNKFCNYFYSDFYICKTINPLSASVALI